MGDWQQPIPPREPEAGATAAAVIAVIFGVILLLPGLCSVFFMSQGLVTSYGFLGLLIGALGIYLIAVARRMR